MLRKIFAGLILTSAIVVAAIVVYGIVQRDKLGFPFGSPQIDRDQSAEVEAVVTRDSLYTRRIDSRDYLRVEYRYVVNGKRYDDHFIATQDLASAHARFARGRVFRFCYNPAYPQFGYIPSGARACGT